MNSIEVKDFEVTLARFIDEYNLPWEVKRLVIADILNQATQKANSEILQQAQERESKETK